MIEAQLVETLLLNQLTTGTSPGKATWPGAKQVWRQTAKRADVVALAAERAPERDAEPLLVEVMRGGGRTRAGSATIAPAAARFDDQWAQLPDSVKARRDPARWDVASTR